MFELGQTVFYDIRIFSLRKSAFIDFFFCCCFVVFFSFLFFFLQKNEDNTSSSYHGCWWLIKRDEASFLFDYLLQPNLGLVRFKDVLMAQ